MYVHKQDIYSGYYICQYAISRNEYWWRCKVYNDWGDWHRIDNFGANTAADLASLLGVSNPFYSVNTSWYTKAKIGTIGRYQNKMLLLRYGNVTSSTQNTALISVNNRDSTTYFTTICKSGSPIIYYKNTSNGTELYLMHESDYSLFEVYIFSNKNENWTIKVEEANIDFSTLTSVNL